MNTYRSDHDAAMARIAALEHELARAIAARPDKPAPPSPDAENRRWIFAAVVMLAVPLQTLVAFAHHEGSFAAGALLSLLCAGLFVYADRRAR
jgi:hypothetical protein